VSMVAETPPPGVAIACSQLRGTLAPGDLSAVVRRAAGARSLEIREIGLDLGTISGAA
jgi:hypothetical protein